MEEFRDTMLILFGMIILPIFICLKCEEGKDPYQEGSHWNYSIECENGFVYKRHKGTIQVLNSDGTPLKCGEKIY